jgi:hypothetical protein
MTREREVLIKNQAIDHRMLLPMPLAKVTRAFLRRGEFTHHWTPARRDYIFVLYLVVLFDCDGSHGTRDTGLTAWPSEQAELRT